METYTWQRYAPGAGGVGHSDGVTVTKALVNSDLSSLYIHSFKVGRVGDEELFDVIQFTHSFLA